MIKNSLNLKFNSTSLLRLFQSFLKLDDTKNTTTLDENTFVTISNGTLYKSYKYPVARKAFKDYIYLAVPITIRCVIKLELEYLKRMSDAEFHAFIKDALMFHSNGSKNSKIVQRFLSTCKSITKDIFMAAMADVHYDKYFVSALDINLNIIACYNKATGKINQQLLVSKNQTLDKPFVTHLNAYLDDGTRESYFLPYQEWHDADIKVDIKKLEKLLEFSIDDLCEYKKDRTQGLSYKVFYFISTLFISSILRTKNMSDILNLESLAKKYAAIINMYNN